MNLPDAIVDLPALSDKDKTDLRFGVQNDIDFVAASFVRKVNSRRVTGQRRLYRRSVNGPGEIKGCLR